MRPMSSVFVGFLLAGRSIRSCFACRAHDLNIYPERQANTSHYPEPYDWDDYTASLIFRRK